MKADFDIGNLIYVVLTVVFLIIGAVGKKKKPANPVSERSGNDEPAPDNIKSQFKEIFREFNPAADLLVAQEYTFQPKDSIEAEQPLDVVPELTTESKLDTIPVPEQAIDSNINYNDQAQSSLDTVGMDEGIPVFDYSKDHNSLIYNKITRGYDTVLTEDEEELAEILNGFDPKTAFVYSEIFNRKEF